MTISRTPDFYSENQEFPVYLVSRPPQEDRVEPLYYKVTGPNGDVFWRNEGDSTGRSTTVFDLLMEEKHGHGIQTLEKKYTPWGDDETNRNG